MTYLTINTNTKEGQELFRMIQKHKAVKVLQTPNEETRQALRDAKAGKGVKEMGNVSDWFKKNFGI
jgi:hypothetical protein